MVDDADELPVGSACLHIDTDPARPGISLVRLVGIDQDGNPDSTKPAVFDTGILIAQMFGPLFRATAEALIGAALRDVTERGDAVISLPQLMTLSEATGEKDVSVLTRFAATVAKQDLAAAQLFARDLLDKVDGTIEFALVAANRILDERRARASAADTEPQEAAAPAQAQSDQAAPPHDDTSSRVDGAASSMTASQGAVLPFKHVDGLGSGRGVAGA